MRRLPLQLPPSLAFDAAVAEAFFDALQAATACVVACEPRHASWFTPQAAASLDAHQVILVQADPSPVAQTTPANPRTQYLRLHGSPDIYRSSYEPLMLEALASALKDEIASGVNSWVIFDNTAQGAAVPNARLLFQLLAS